MSGISFLPAREIQYHQVQGEASLGLITAPGFTMFMVLLDDVLKTFMATFTLMTLHSIWWREFVVRSWPNGGDIWGLGLACCIYMYHQTVMFSGLFYAGAPMA